MHAVSWEFICKVKKYGGLGLRNLEIVNNAMLGRIAWSILIKPMSLCSMVLSGKYSRHRDLAKECIAKKSDSEIRRNLARIWPKVTKNV